MIINHNIPAEFAHRFSATANIAAAKSSEKLASGLRINRAADDAAGLAISEKMRGQIRGLSQALRNTLDGISFVQTTEGYLAASHNVLQRVRELAVQSANGTYTQSDRMMIQVEVSQLVDEIDRIASQAQFNQFNMLTGRFANPTASAAGGEPFYVHLGPNTDHREALHIDNLDAASMGLKTVGGGAGSGAASIISLSTLEKANRAIADVDKAIEYVSRQRANLGAYQNRLEFASEAIRIGHENLQAAESRIRDTDMASQTTLNGRNMILLQTSVAMIGQANMTPQLVLRLLQ